MFLPLDLDLFMKAGTPSEEHFWSQEHEYWPAKSSDYFSVSVDRTFRFVYSRDGWKRGVVKYAYAIGVRFVIT